MVDLHKEFVEFMMTCDVLRFGNFKTKSGRMTPYFVNTGNYKIGSQIAKLGEFYAAHIKQTLGTDFDAIFGPAYKGIPLVITTAVSLSNDFSIDKPYFFNRKEEKDHGEGGNLIGYKPKDGDRIVVIEDVITAGTAIRETIPMLKAIADVKITDMFISIDRCEIGQNPGKTAVMEVKEEFDINVHSLATVRDIKNFIESKPEYNYLSNDIDNYMKQYCIL